MKKYLLMVAALSLSAVTIQAQHSSPPVSQITSLNSSTACGVISFAPQKTFASDRNPQFVESADLDGDGIMDLAVVNDTHSTISVLRGTSSVGNISFEDTINYNTTGKAPSFIAIGDLDGDGKRDMVVSDFQGDSISIFRNTSVPGSISFSPAINYPTEKWGFGLAIGDIDQDGLPDIAVGHATDVGTQTSDVSLYRNMSTPGHIQFNQAINIQAGIFPSDVFITDLDGDGISDLAVSNYGGKSLSVFRNISTPGKFTFAPRIDYATGYNPYCIFAADLDGDGKKDLATANLYSHSITVYKNSSSPGTISFTSRTDYSTTNYDRSVVLADLNGDGKPEMINENSGGSNTVSVFENTSTPGAISFANRMDFAVGEDPFNVTAADLDGDGKMDLAAANWTSANVSVLRNTYNNCASGISISAITDVNTSQAVVHWYPVQNATSYVLRGYRAGTTNYFYIGYTTPITDTFIKITNRLPSTKYKVQVKAFLSGSSGGTSWSAPASFVTLDSCTAPSALNVTNITGNSAQLNWSNSGITSYDFKIRYRALGATEWTELWLQATATSTVLSGLLSNTTYNWQIKRKCPQDASQWINGYYFTTASSVAILSGGVASSASKEASELTVKVMPNPNNGNFTVQMQLPKAAAATILTLYNNTGEMVWQQDAGKISGSVYRNMSLNNKLSPGTYILVVQRNDARLEQKIVINK
jgi:hypothetical protein